MGMLNMELRPKAPAAATESVVSVGFITIMEVMTFSLYSL
jgi:hypothetical protein